MIVVPVLDLNMKMDAIMKLALIAGFKRYRADVLIEDYIEKIRIKINKEVKHRILNSGDTLLVFIEVQTGTYFGEDDIVRIEDDYKRI